MDTWGSLSFLTCNTLRLFSVPLPFQNRYVFYFLRRFLLFLELKGKKWEGKVLRKRYEDEIYVFFLCERKGKLRKFFIHFTCEMMYKKVTKVLITRRSGLFVCFLGTTPSTIFSIKSLFSTFYIQKSVSDTIM